MLDANLKTQLKAYLEKVTQPYEIVASLDDGEKSREMLALLEDINALSDKISLNTAGQDARVPSFGFRRNGRVSPVSRWATSSPRWCSPCCKSVAIRPSSRPT